MYACILYSTGRGRSDDFVKWVKSQVSYSIVRTFSLKKVSTALVFSQLTQSHFNVLHSTLLPCISIQTFFVVSNNLFAAAALFNMCKDDE
jgi:hypothetical protein